MSWILIALLQTQFAPSNMMSSTIAVDFSTQAQCEAARAQVGALIPANSKTQSYVLRSYCVQK